MPYLISIAAAGLLFLGFLFLTAYEARRGVRFFPAFRYKLDANLARVQFLIDHIDWGAFTAHLTRTSLTTVAHDAAHGTLVGVRAVERELARAVSALRMRREGTTSLPPRHDDAPRGKRIVTFISNSFHGSRRTRPMSDIVRKEEPGE